MIGSIWLFIMSLLLLSITLPTTIITIKKIQKSKLDSCNLLELIFSILGLIMAIIGLFISATVFSTYMSDCPICGTQRKANDYCITCGYNFNQEKICPNCKENIENSSIFCGHCGGYILK